MLYYLVRLYPEYMLCLQNGKFDTADRLFFSVEQTWRGVTSNQADVKELIPQFYEVPQQSEDDFLVNSKDLDLGVRYGGLRVNHVQVPPWAKDAQDFHRICRDALESEYVCQRLHHWIDLIFGYKQVRQRLSRCVWSSLAIERRGSTQGPQCVPSHVPVRRRY